MPPADPPGPWSRPVAPAWEQRCLTCARSYPLPAPIWRCTCGGLLELAGPIAPDPVDPSAPWSMWRYRRALPPLPAHASVTLGEGMTPLVDGPGGTSLKLDFCNPTLSFKDRGAVAVVAAAAALGAQRVVTDSSGNAGTAVAAYAVRAGIAAEVWVPAATSAKKLAAMEAHGARVRRVDGDREAAARAARERVETTSSFYASHVWQPLFAHGVKTVGYEIWEQLGRRSPSSAVVPAGNGTLVLGVALAFAELAAAGLVERVPRIVAVQAARCAPLAGLAPSGDTVAEGIAIAAPPRAAEVLAALNHFGGGVVTVGEDDILAGQRELASMGIWVEPTAAAAWAGRGSDPDGTVVVLCGAGAKSGGPSGC